ncbi:adenylate/guanylate cyclase domain-containing protein [Flavitalea sp.]|nr:adenylate/guanylate cyclase domain-containing protein [Flavitalea sp.]
MLTPKTRTSVLRILPFGVIWLIFSLAYTLLERGILGESGYYPSTGNPYYFKRNIIITPVSALLSGLLIGTFEILYFNKLFTQKSFLRKIILKSFIYLAIIISFLIITTVFAHSLDLHASVFDKQVWYYVWAFFFDYAFLSVALYMAVVIVVSQFYNEVSENIGLNVLNNFLTGKYHSPKEEKRIFMFLDMRSSSSFAESLGHVRYFEMLRKYYSDLSDPIIKYSGEIYQYVGDEIVVSWKLQNGLKDNNCIECFYAMKAALKKQTPKYEREFGVVPGFKAGFHFGKVTTGEIGEIKKEIIFTGDVLNTTARIQALCNFYQVDILLSGELIKQLRLDTGYLVRSLGETELRGKEEKVELYSIDSYD